MVSSLYWKDTSWYILSKRTTRDVNGSDYNQEKVFEIHGVGLFVDL
jgi:hypothetical protein